MTTSLITGGRGFIGANLAQYLAKKGEFVKLLNRPGSSISNEIKNNPNIEVVSDDITDLNSLVEASKNCNQIYHLAAFAKPWAKDLSTFERVNIEGTENVLKAAQANQISNIVITSSAGTFGPQQDENPVTEKTIPRSLFTEYERTKFKSVEHCKTYLDLGMNIRFVSPTRVFGPGELSTSNAVTKLIRDYAKGTFRFLPGDGNGIGNYAFISDVVEGHHLAMQHGQKGENYILGGENLSYREFFNLVGLVCGTRRKMIGFPIPIMLGASKAMEFLADTTGIEPVITPPFVRKYTHNWATDLSKAQEELGYKITTAEEAIRITYNWLTEL